MLKIERVEVGPLRNLLIERASKSRHEVVGILLGVVKEGVGRIYAIYLVENLKKSPVAFEADPWQVVQSYKSSEKYGIEVIGIFHTHTSCPASPSPRDVEGMRAWPYIWLIACPEELRAWLPGAREPVEVSLT
ncbi:MAG: M67 family metallopeptidase [Desulfurococcales archaeon]|nr:M67 family metallopeptidase [Desulfurococcales archaeon]